MSQRPGRGASGEGRSGGRGRGRARGRGGGGRGREPSSSARGGGVPRPGRQQREAVLPTSPEVPPPGLHMNPAAAARTPHVPPPSSTSVGDTSLKGHHYSQSATPLATNPSSGGVARSRQQQVTHPTLPTGVPGSGAGGRQQQATPSTPPTSVSRRQQQATPSTPPTNVSRSEQQRATPSTPPQLALPSTPSTPSRVTRSDPTVPPTASQMPTSSGGAGQAQAPSTKGPTNYHGRPQPPNRPGFGTAGRKMMVRSNFFPIRLPRDMTVYHYDVVIEPQKLPKSALRKVYEEFQKQQGVIGAYDGSKSSYYSRPPFTGDTKSFTVQVRLEEGEEAKQCKFKVTLKKAAVFSIDLHRIQGMVHDMSETMPKIQAIDVILRHLPALHTVPVGRSFFSPSASPFLLGEGREMWSGYYQSVRQAMGLPAQAQMGWKLMLNVDTAATAFYTQQSVFDFLCVTLRRCSPRDATEPVSDRDRQHFGSCRELTDADRRKFCKEIKGLKIVVTHLSYKRKYKVVDVTQKSARNQKFPLEGGTEISVEQYFKQTYPDSPLTHPHLPCLQVGQKSRNIYLPIDVCEIMPGQRCMKKLTDTQTTRMIRETAKPASQRERTINDTVRRAQFNKDKVAGSFGISVDTKMVEIESRVLDPPQLMYRGGGNVTPESGKGAWEMKGKKFYNGITVKKWAVLVCDSRCGRSEYDGFIRSLIRRSEDMGMEMSPNPIIRELRGRMTVEEAFDRLVHSEGKLDLVVAIIDKRESHYNQVKRLGDTEGGVAIATQCVQSKTVKEKCNPATLGNICLKINARLGGTNSIVGGPSVLQRMPVIIFGADVTHPRSEDTTSPSIASVVASVDLAGGHYRALHRNQKHRKEIIADLQAMAKEHFIQFRRCTGQKPVKVIFYRDGVSDGQFDAVRQEEVAALQGACLDLQPNGSYQPKITFIVVQKRHHARFFPKFRDDPLVGRGQNVPPGTTVDTVITHPTQHDFYLCSHAAIQGTSRPCHYHVLWDDSDFGADELQLLSYQLCHMFWRCNRSVSYPAPTYYAHRDAAHARMLLQAHEESSGSSTVGSDHRISRSEMDSAIEIHGERKTKMYFM